MTAAPAVPAVRVPERVGDELARLIRSRFALVYVDSSEEARAEGLIRGATHACGRTLWTWSISDGLVEGPSGTPDPATSDPEQALRRIADSSDHDVYVMRDLARHVEQHPATERLLRDIARDTEATIVLLGPHGPIPAALQTSAALVDLPRPDHALIEAHVRSHVARAGRQHGVRQTLDDAGMAVLAGSLRGLTLEQVDQVLLHILHDDGILDAADLERALHEKGRLLASTGVLALESPVHGLEWVAGFPNLKQWIAQRGAAFGPGAAQFGLPAPRGLLLTGVPGCGKSFVAKAIARTWNMPLLRLDAGSLYDSFVGASERNLREALATAGALAPSILWIDEIEKGFGSTGPSESDGGLGYRLLGTLATWMQERPHPVFLLATSNDITKLPPELTRQGRFDETFFVDLPDELSREHLFRLQLARAGRDHARFDCPSLAAASDGFSGSEVEQSITNALYAAFAAGRDVVTEDIARELAATRPLSVVSPEVVDRIRRWGASHARPA
ncbi:MAG: ATPase [Thermoleophilia bacterium]|nr:ATPase [Thermoleophilia bacterium]